MQEDNDVVQENETKEHTNEGYEGNANERPKIHCKGAGL